MPNLVGDRVAEQYSVAQCAGPRPPYRGVGENRDARPAVRRHGGVSQLLALHRSLGLEDPQDHIRRPERVGAACGARLRAAGITFDDLESGEGPCGVQGAFWLDMKRT